MCAIDVIKKVDSRRSLIAVVKFISFHDYGRNFATKTFECFGLSTLMRPEAPSGAKGLSLREAFFRPLINA